MSSHQPCHTLAGLPQCRPLRYFFPHLRCSPEESRGEVERALREQGKRREQKGIIWGINLISQYRSKNRGGAGGRSQVASQIEHKAEQKYCRSINYGSYQHYQHSYDDADCDDAWQFCQQLGGAEPYFSAFCHRNRSVRS